MGGCLAETVLALASDERTTAPGAAVGTSAEDAEDVAAALVAVSLEGKSTLPRGVFCGEVRREVPGTQCEAMFRSDVSDRVGVRGDVNVNVDGGTAPAGVDVRRASPSVEEGPASSDDDDDDDEDGRNRRLGPVLLLLLVLPLLLPPPPPLLLLQAGAACFALAVVLGAEIVRLCMDEALRDAGPLSPPEDAWCC